MISKNPYEQQAFLEAKVNSATPEELTLMLYDGAIKFANQALMALEKEDRIKFIERVQKVRNIIKVLQSTLLEGYEISGQLYSLYDYLIRILTQGIREKDPSKIEESLKIIRSLRDSWKEAMKIAKAGKK